MAKGAWRLGVVLGLTLAASAASRADELAATSSDFSGHWSGNGRLITHNSFFGGSEGPCSSIDLTIEHLPAKLTIQRYHAICSQLDSDWGPSVMEIRDGKVYEDGEETGTFDGDIFKTLQRSGAIQYAFNLRLAPQSASAPVLQTYYGVRNAAGTMVIEGNLNPVR